MSSSPSGGVGGAGGTSGTGGLAGMPNTPAPGPDCTNVAPDPGPAFARRLTRFEYNNTIRDLGLPTGSNEAAAAGFPTEERRNGFDNNADALTVSPLLAEQYMLTAERIAGAAVDTGMANLLQGCTVTATNEATCAESFFTKFGRRMYRRPLGDDDLLILRNVYKVGRETDFATGIKLALMTMLQSPRFLYRIEFGATPKAGEKIVRLDPYETATRLAYLLWASPPDATLLDAAGAGKLSTADELKAQVDRMLDPAAANANKLKHAKEMVANFHDQWFDLPRVLDIEKDAKIFPTFNKGVLGNWQRETQRFLDWVFWDGGGDLPALLTAKVTFADENLAKFYGIPYPAMVGPDGMPITTVQKIDLVDKARGGLLTQGAILGLYAGPNQTSPVLRGKFVREELLCQPLPPPPNDVMIVLPPLDPNLTTRERFSKHATLDACKGCHTLMDPIGLGFEKYDGVGLYRETENTRPVDASGDVVGMTGGKFNGVIELSQKLATSTELRACVAMKWFQYAYGRDYLPELGDTCTLDKIKRQFTAGDYKFRSLLLALANSDAFLYRRVTPTGGTP